MSDQAFDAEGAEHWRRGRRGGANADSPLAPGAGVGTREDLLPAVGAAPGLTQRAHDGSPAGT
jgi:hypothetical protein